MPDATTQTDGVPAARVNKKVIIGIVAAVVVVAIALIVFFMTRTPGNVAAKVGDSYITEDEVTEKIATYRTNYSLTDDSDFAEFLNYYGQTVSQFRESAINELATQMLVEKRAEELGITVSDDEVEAYYDNIKGDNDTSEGSTWATVLEEAGLTEDSLKERYRYNIMQNKVLAEDVAERDATDDELLTYTQDYLAGSTQVHIAHIVISGDDADSRSTECYEKVAAARDAGTLSSTTFAELAKQYSDEEDVETTGGSVGWSGCGLISDEVLDALDEMESEDIAANTLLGRYEASDGSYEIAYLDDVFTFPASSEITSVSDLGMPDDLLEVIKNAAKSEAYSDDCSAYLTKMLEDANITYYPMPSDVPYNVSLAQ